MQLYWQVARRSFRRYASYRGATLAALFTNMVWGLLLSAVVSAVIDSRGGQPIDGLDRAGLITQIWLGQGLLGVVDTFFRWQDLAERIRNGDVVVDMYRPVDLQAWWAAVDAGRAAYELCVRFVPPVAVGVLFFGARLPQPADVPAVAAAMVLAVAVSFSIRFLASASGFWLLDARGVQRLVLTTWIVGSGMTIPLPLLPDVIEGPIRALPFASTVQIVSDVWTGTASPSVAAALGRQALWAVALIAVSRVVLARATRRVVIQGG